MDKLWTKIGQNNGQKMTKMTNNDKWWQIMTKKWPKNDQKMTKQWQKNDQEMTKKWQKIDKKTDKKRPKIDPNRPKTGTNIVIIKTYQIETRNRPSMIFLIFTLHADLLRGRKIAWFSSWLAKNGFLTLPLPFFVLKIDTFGSEKA